MTFSVAQYFAGQQPAWLRPARLADVATNDATTALIRAQDAQNQLIGALASTTLDQALTLDREEAARKFTAERDGRARRLNAIASLAGSGLGITPPAMRRLTGFSESGNPLDVARGYMDRATAMDLPLYEALRGAYGAVSNTPSIPAARS